MASLAEQPFNMFPSRPDSDEYGRYSEHSNAGFGMPPTTGPLDMTLSAFPRSGHDLYSIPTTAGFEQSLFAPETSHFMLQGHPSPNMYAEETDMRLPSSSLSTASATSSAMGSPLSNHGQSNAAAEWGTHGLGVRPGIVSNDYMPGSEYSGYSSHGIEEMNFDLGQPKGFVDPTMIHHELNAGSRGVPHYDAHFQQPNQQYPTSPSGSSSSLQNHVLRTNSSSPSVFNNTTFQHQQFPNSPFAAPADQTARRPSVNFISPPSGEYNSGDEAKEKQRCTYPDCGKVFKDLKAHMLTHQNERPEKCPIQTCEYHTKGFARKYDKNRHTLTHYKGTMVCGFCPGSGSPSEKSFNRADVFKRHLTSVHGVEQTPPNSRRKLSSGVNVGKKLSSYCPDATGKCSTCSHTFANAQDFYEHLDDCVLRIVQLEDPAEAINAQRLNEVENDKDVHETLEKNKLPVTTSTSAEEADEGDDADMGEDGDGDNSPNSNSSKTTKKSPNSNGVHKSRGMTHSRGGVPLTKTRGRKDRRGYPDSWGFHPSQMNLKKRVLAVFDGSRRLVKDDMMLSTDHEVRISLADGKSYVTDLDIQSLKRAEGFLGATDAEKGPWISDDPTEAQLREMRELQEIQEMREMLATE